MKKILSFILFFLSFSLGAADYNISINGFSYTPHTLNVAAGDMITIEASSTHPLVQVDEATWNANGNTPLSGGWGIKTSPFAFSPADLGTIYFVCQAHAGIGMKGKIVVQTAAVMNEPKNILYVSLYPNPVQTYGILTVNAKTGSNVTATVLNILGVPVKDVITAARIYGENEYTFDATDLPAGNYIMFVKDERKKYYQKFVVVK